MDACRPRRATKRRRLSIDHDHTLWERADREKRPEGARWERQLSPGAKVLAAHVERFLSPFSQCHRPVTARTHLDSARRLPERPSRAETRSDKRVACRGGGNSAVKSHAGVLAIMLSCLDLQGRASRCWYADSRPSCRRGPSPRPSRPHASTAWPAAPATVRRWSPMGAIAVVSAPQSRRALEWYL